jgi:hypothetical protein
MARHSPSGGGPTHADEGEPVTMNNPIRLNDDGLFLCPVCDCDTTHMEIVRVAARREDRTFNEITVNAITGQITTHGEVPAPTGSMQGKGRRQRIAVTGWCEEGNHSFAVVFTQHKGGTYIETVDSIDHEVVGDPF